MSRVKLAVCGLHMRGYQLNYQLQELGAEFVSRTYTGAEYLLYALNTVPPKPGLIKTVEGGQKIEVEVFNISYEGLGKFLEQIPSPLGLGKITLEDGSSVIGFICEPYAIEDATDITSFGGWRYYFNRLKNDQNGGKV